MSERDLPGSRVVVAGAGLAGLSAARALEARGAEVTIVEARERVGGRVWTIRDQFAGGQHAEAGADLIEEEQEHTLQLARELGLKPVRILRAGFGFYGPDSRGKRRIHLGPGSWAAVARMLEPDIEDFKLSEERWDSAVAARLARTSVWDDPGFDPLWRAWLARPAGPIVFAGEHTSIKFQGYMNGAIETGLRAAAELGALRSSA